MFNFDFIYNRLKDFGFDMEHYTERRCSNKLFGMSVTLLTSDSQDESQGLFRKMENESILRRTQSVTNFEDIQGIETISCL